jgi:phage shock protein A
MSVIDKVRKALAGTILELEDARRAATAELIQFKAGEKQMAARIAELDGEVAAWQRRAEQAVLAGDDELAREALARKAELAAERERVQADRAEQVRYAQELLRGRRELDAKLQMLKLREGSVAAGIAAAQPGGNPFATEGGAWDRFEDAERAIEEESVLGELAGEELDQAALAQQKVRQQGHAARAEDALEALKRKMRGDG